MQRIVVSSDISAKVVLVLFCSLYVRDFVQVAGVSEPLERRTVEIVVM